MILGGWFIYSFSEKTGALADNVPAKQQVRRIRIFLFENMIIISI
jgi:hypothetical protein